MPLTPLIAILSILVLGACTTAPPPAAEAPRATGYTLSGDTVVFQFRPWEFAYVTNGKTGAWVSLGEFPRIDTVAVAGPFNGWSTEADFLTAEGGSYSLSMPRSALEAFGPQIPFKFVINGLWWVEPPVVAANSAKTNLTNKSSNLILTLP